MSYWLMRAGKGGIAKGFCTQQGVIAMDWNQGDMSSLPDDLEAFKEVYCKAHKVDSDGEVNANAATNHRFVYRMQNGDWVALSNAQDQWIYFGRVESSYYYAPPPPAESKEFRHQRKVKWEIAYPRTAFSELFLLSRYLIGQLMRGAACRFSG